MFSKNWSKLSKIVKIVKNCQNCQKLAKIVKSPKLLSEKSAMVNKHPTKYKPPLLKLWRNNKERKRFQRGHRVQRRQGGGRSHRKGNFLRAARQLALDRCCCCLKNIFASFALFYQLWGLGLPFCQFLGGLGLLGLECKIL